MCGIVGAAGQLSVSEEKAFRTLLILDSLRGEHSTGVASVDVNEEVVIAKSVGDPFQLFDTGQYDAIKRRSNRVLLGHNRFATTGKVNRANAHPYHFGDIVGVHNGTLTNKGSLQGGGAFDVDSQALYNSINLIGVSKTIESCLGAWALVFWREKENTINFLRNKERPLYYCFNKSKTAIFWASEHWMLEVSLSREKIPFEEILPVPEDTLMSFEIGMLPWRDMPVIDKARIRQVKGKEVVTTTYYGGNQSNKNVYSLGLLKREMWTKDTDFVLEKLMKDVNGSSYILCKSEVHPEIVFRLYLTSYNSEMVEHLGETVSSSISGCVNTAGGCYYKLSVNGCKLKEKEDTGLKKDFLVPFGSDGKEISKEDFEKKFHTCSWCSQSIEYGDICEVIDKEGTIICEDCITEPSVNQYLKGVFK